MAKKTLNVQGIVSILNPSNSEKRLINDRTFVVTVSLNKTEYCEKCYGVMMKDPEVGWIQAETGPIAGYDVHKYKCGGCGYEHEVHISAD